MRITTFILFLNYYFSQAIASTGHAAIASSTHASSYESKVFTTLNHSSSSSKTSQDMATQALHPIQLESTLG